ncbi:hypothetical protein JCM33774_42400 [Actinophytocola sp. KF-1]
MKLSRSPCTGARSAVAGAALTTANAAVAVTAKRSNFELTVSSSPRFGVRIVVDPGKLRRTRR